MKRYGENFTLSQDLMDVIANYMDSEVRERLHFRFAPCEPDFFLREYLKEDKNFEKLLKTEFRIEME